MLNRIAAAFTPHPSEYPVIPFTRRPHLNILLNRAAAATIWLAVAALVAWDMLA